MRRHAMHDDNVMELRMNLFGNEIGTKIGKRIYAVSQVIQESPLPKTIQELVQLRASQINGCGFCVDIHGKDAATAGEDHGGQDINPDPGEYEQQKNRCTKERDQAHDKAGGADGALERTGQRLPVDDDLSSARLEEEPPYDNGEHCQRQPDRNFFCHARLPRYDGPSRLCHSDQLARDEFRLGIGMEARRGDHFRQPERCFHHRGEPFLRRDINPVAWRGIIFFHRRPRTPIAHRSLRV